ncbi:MAG: hypothetical protein ABJA87_09425 [bacterium]
MTTTTDPAQGAAGWLGQQLLDASGTPSPSGDHLDYVGFPGFDGGTTADVVFALAAAGVGGDKIDAIMKYYAAHVDEYTSAADTTGAPGPSAGAVGKAALAAIVAGRDPHSFGGFDLVNILKTSECKAVSAPTETDFSIPNCPAIGAGRNVYSSIAESFVILAQARTSTTSETGLTYLLSLQCTDGGFTGDVTTTGGCTSDVDATAYATTALIAAGGHRAAVGRAVGWLTGKRSSAGYWVSQGGPNVDSTGLAASALAAAGRDVTTSRQWLASQQVLVAPTLGAGASRGALKYLGTFSGSSIKATADGLLGLSPDTSLATVTAARARAGLPVLAPAGTVGSARVRAGATQTVTVDGFSRGEKVTAVLHSPSVPLTGTTAGANGRARLSFTVASGTAVGRHEVVLTGASSTLSATVAFTVLAASAPASSTSAAPSSRPAGSSGTPVSSTPVSSSAPPVGAGPELAATGLDRGRSGGLAAIGAALLVAGAGLIHVGRRAR